VPRLVGFWPRRSGTSVSRRPTGSLRGKTSRASADSRRISGTTWGALIDPDGGPRIFFQRVPEGKTAKNRMHLDLNVGDGLEGEARTERVREEADRIEALGATRRREVDERGEFYIVMQDFEGNELCLQ